MTDPAPEHAPEGQLYDLTIEASATVTPGPGRPENEETE